MAKLLTIEKGDNAGYAIRSEFGFTIHSTLDEALQALRDVFAPLEVPVDRMK